MASTTGNTSSHTASVVGRPIPLETGDHLDQKSFHARYEAMPSDTKAELIGGVVYMMSPMKNPHGRHTRDVSFWLRTYELATPGVEGGDGLTTILGHDSEPQPDACLYVRPENGGRVRINEDGYTEGAPELIVEVASGTESYDLHSKKRDYEAAGVCEYVVVALRQRQVFWFVRRDGAMNHLWQAKMASIAAKSSQGCGSILNHSSTWTGYASDLCWSKVWQVLNTRCSRRSWARHNRLRDATPLSFALTSCPTVSIDK